MQQMSSGPLKLKDDMAMALAESLLPRIWLTIGEQVQLESYNYHYFIGVSKWIRYHNRHGAQLIEANTDTITAVLRSLDPPLIASKIRIVPHFRSNTNNMSACRIAWLFV